MMKSLVVASLVMMTGSVVAFAPVVRTVNSHKVATALASRQTVDIMRLYMSDDDKVSAPLSCQVLADMNILIGLLIVCFLFFGRPVSLGGPCSSHTSNPAWTSFKRVEALNIEIYFSVLTTVIFDRDGKRQNQP